MGELRTGVAEHLPVEDASVDAVISTLVLCSVSDQAQALSEILRVLRPGGRYVFIEHVAADQDSGLYRTQNLIKPIWTFVGDGCQPNRDTAAAIEQAGFSQVEITPFRAPVPFASPAHRRVRDQVGEKKQLNRQEHSENTEDNQLLGVLAVNHLSFGTRPTRDRGRRRSAG